MKSNKQVKDRILKLEKKMKRLLDSADHPGDTAQKIFSAEIEIKTLKWFLKKPRRKK